MCSMLELLDTSPGSENKKLTTLDAMRRAGGAAGETTLCQFEGGSKCPYYEPATEPKTGIRTSKPPESGER
jgi:hypothetical protein